MRVGSELTVTNFHLRCSTGNTVWIWIFVLQNACSYPRYAGSKHHSPTAYSPKARVRSLGNHCGPNSNIRDLGGVPIPRTSLPHTSTPLSVIAVTGDPKLEPLLADGDPVSTKGGNKRNKKLPNQVYFGPARSHKIPRTTKIVQSMTISCAQRALEC
jgi:hypothetical protein